MKINIIQEQQQNLSEYCKNLKQLQKDTLFEEFYVIFLSLLDLAMSFTKFNFVHCNLHPLNIFVQNLKEPIIF